MNVLFRLKKDMAITGLLPFRYLLYAALLSDVVSYEPEGEDIRYGVYGGEQNDLYDRFSDWSDADERKDEVLKALNDLADEGLIFFDDDDRVYLGEFRGKRFFAFDCKSSLFDEAVVSFDTELKRYGASRSAKDKSRAPQTRAMRDNNPHAECAFLLCPFRIPKEPKYHRKSPFARPKHPSAQAFL